MTDSGWTMIDYRKPWILVGFGGLAGVLVGWIAWTTVLSFSQATFIVSIGQVQQGIPSGTIGQPIKLDQAFLEDPSALIERVRSPSFASAIAARTGIAELSDALPARQYGGRGMLAARSLRPPSQGLPNLIEVRISSLSPDMAGNAARAAAEQIVEEHKVLLEPFVSAMKKRGDLLEEQIILIRKSDEQMAQKIEKNSDHQASDISDAVLVGAKLLSEKRALDLELTAYDAKLAILTQNTRRTMVLFAPATSIPRRAWAFMAPVSGGLAGMIFMFLALRVWQEITERRKRVLASEVD